MTLLQQMRDHQENLGETCSMCTGNHTGACYDCETKVELKTVREDIQKYHTENPEVAGGEFPIA